jgi:hypothetical protein
MTIENTLTERECRYGAFADHARLSQHLTDVMRSAPKWEGLSAVQKEALEMIQHKVARILNGDPCYGDNWHDIAGYATLVEQNLEAGVEPPQTEPVEGMLEAIVEIAWQKIPVKETGDWTCRHGDDNILPSIVPVGEACPVCFSTK